MKIKSLKKSVPSSFRKVRSFKSEPTFEPMEARQLMATGFVAGFATHAGGVVDTAATIQLAPATSTGTITGTASTTTTNSDGYYQFNNVAPGYYVVSETETGYATSSVSATTTVNPATAINGNTSFLVDVLDPSTQSITATHVVDPYNDGIIYASANGSPFESSLLGGDNANQFLFSLAGNQGNQTSLVTLCTSLYQAFNAGGPGYGVTPSTTPTIPTGITGLSQTSAASVGQIGYLYNTYGNTVIDAGNADGNQTNDGAGLQAAIWSLLYNPATTLAGQEAALVSTSSNFYMTSQTPAAIITAADNYLAASFGKSEDAYFLNVAPASSPSVNGQSLIATDQLNFVSSPSVTGNDVISGNVFLDANNNITNANLPGDSPLAGVTVTLTGTVNGHAITPVVTTTSSTGTYSFGTLQPGTYTVTETPPAGYNHEGQAAGSTGGTTGTNSITTTLATSGLNSTNNNFAEVGQSQISGTVYIDASGNGLTGSTNAPLPGDTVEPGVTVILFNSSLKQIATTTTSSTGAYSFINLPYGTYYVAEATPANYVETSPAGSYYIPTTTSAAPSSTNNNFANYMPCSTSSIGNIQYFVNGVQVPTLTGYGYEGATVTVKFTDSSTMPVSLVAYTAPAPYWNTTNRSQQVLVGDSVIYPTGNPSTVYTETVTIPDCYYQVDFVCGLPLTQLGSPNSNIDYNTENRLISHDNGGTNACLPSTISGVVYIDNNGNGTYGAGDTGVGGVTVTLSGTLDTGVPFTPVTTVTSSTGAYSFGNLLPGIYTVSEPSPTGYTLENSNVGSIGGTSSPGKTTNIALNTNTSAINYNFGQIAPGSIAGTVYIDTTGNGLASGEAGQSGVTVVLFQNGVAIATQVTGSNGSYDFTGVAPGTYSVAEVVPTGFYQTGPSGLIYTQTETLGQNITQDNFSNYAACPTGSITGESVTVYSCGCGCSGPVNTYSSLGGNTAEGEQVTVNFTVTGSQPVMVTLVSYVATSNFDLTKQTVFSDDTETLAPGKHSLTVTIPNSYYQIDFVCGAAITSFNPSANVTYHGEGRFFDSDNGGSENAPNCSVGGNWNESNIGSPGQCGSANYNGSTGVLTLSGGGSDIWNSSDQFNYEYNTLTGDGTIYAEVLSQTNTDPWAKAGVMLRASSAANAAFVDVVQTPGNGVAFQYRDASGNLGNIQGPSINGPVYVEIVRTGSTFTGYYSTNGTSWTAIGSTTQTMPTTELAGFAVTAHNNASLSVANFGNFGITASSSSAANFASVSGSLFSDDIYSGCWNNYDTSLSGIEVQLKGTDCNGQSVCETRFTDANGNYSFTGLQPGTYSVTELAANSYDITKATVGTDNGSTDGSTSCYNNSTISNIKLGCGDSATGYNYTANQESCGVGKGNTAAWSFWCGSKGQNLISCFNGGSSATYLGNWLAQTCPNLFGGLAGKSNGYVASYCQQLSWSGCSNNQSTGQILSLALSCYATDTNLCWTWAGQSYGFQVNNTFGCGVNTVNWGSSFSSWGMSGTTTTFDFLKWCDSQSSSNNCGNGNYWFQSAVQSACGNVNSWGGIW